MSATVSTHHLIQYKTHDAFNVVASQFIKHFHLHPDIIHLIHEAITDVEHKRKRTWTITLVAYHNPTDLHIMKFLAFRYRNICDILHGIDFNGDIYIDPNKDNRHPNRSYRLVNGIILNPPFPPTFKYMHFHISAQIPTSDELREIWSEQKQLSQEVQRLYPFQVLDPDRYNKARIKYEFHSKEYDFMYDKIVKSLDKS